MLSDSIQHQLTSTVTRLLQQCQKLEAENSQLKREVHEAKSALVTAQQMKIGQGLTVQYLAGLQRALYICQALYDSQPAYNAIQAEMDRLISTLKQG